MSWLSSDSDKAKQTQEMHCSAGKRLKCSDPIPAEMRSILLDSERKSQRTRSGVAFEDSARSREPLHGLRSSRASTVTTDTRCQNAILQGTRPVRTPGISHRRRPAQTETLAGTDHGSCLPLTRSYPFSFSDLPPQGSGAGRRAEVGRPTHGRGRIYFLDPPGPRPAFGRPGSPERDCGPGRQSRNRPELSTPRTRCSALHARLGSSWESRAQAQARRTRMSHSGRIQPPAGLGWKTHMSGPVKW